MEIMEFGVDEIEIDDRCVAEQVLTRAPGREAIYYGPHEVGGVSNGDDEAVTEAGQALIPLNDLRSDSYEPVLHMTVVRYFGLTYKGFRQAGKRNSRPTKHTGWFKGTISMCWVGQQAADKGVKYCRIKYDDGEKEDVEYNEIRRIILTLMMEREVITASRRVHWKDLYNPPCSLLAMWSDLSSGRAFAG